VQWRDVCDNSVSVADPARQETLVEDYLAHRGAAGVSPNTIRPAYGLRLRAVFLRWWAEHEVTEPPNPPRRRSTRRLSILDQARISASGQRGSLFQCPRRWRPGECG